MPDPTANPPPRKRRRDNDGFAFAVPTRPQRARITTLGGPGKRGQPTQKTRFRPLQALPCVPGVSAPDAFEPTCETPDTPKEVSDSTLGDSGFDDNTPVIDLEDRSEAKKSKAVSVRGARLTHAVLTYCNLALAQALLRAWIPLTQEYLDEMLRQEAGSGRVCVCDECTADTAQYRCLDCVGAPLRSSSCIVRSHEHHPLHRIQVSARQCIKMMQI